METFKNLTVWKEAHEFVLKIYQITNSFPQEEKFGLTSQMRRAAVAIPANIAEGYKRRGIKDKIRFYNIADSSLEEVKYYLILSNDLNYIRDTADLNAKSEQVGKLLNGLTRSTERRL